MRMTFTSKRGSRSFDRLNNRRSRAIFRAWLFKIVRNTAIDAKRKKNAGTDRPNDVAIDRSDP